MFSYYTKPRRKSNILINVCIDLTGHIDYNKMCIRDRYVNLRPITLLKGAPCPLKDVRREDIDMLFVRENSEGEYAGSGSWLFKGKPNEVVIQDGVFSRTCLLYTSTAGIPDPDSLVFRKNP